VSMPTGQSDGQTPDRYIKPGPHQQQCRSNVRLCCQKRQQCRTSFALKLRPFDKVERCFDIVAQNGNIVEATGNKVDCCFDNVASTLLLVWTELYVSCCTRLWWRLGLCCRLCLRARVGLFVHNINVLWLNT